MGLISARNVGFCDRLLFSFADERSPDAAIMGFSPPKAAPSPIKTAAELSAAMESPVKPKQAVDLITPDFPSPDTPKKRKNKKGKKKKGKKEDSAESSDATDDDGAEDQEE